MRKKTAKARADGQPVPAAETMRRVSKRLLFWIVFAVAALVYSQSQFWNAPSGGDRANWDYFAQVIARGGVPYRDVVNIKSPLSAYIGAAAIILTRPFGVRDILAIRITFVVLAALTSAFTFLVAWDYFGSRPVAVIAATVMLTFSAFARFNSGGIQPKTPMVLFGLVSLWALKKDRPVWSGMFGMFSALSWQPGLLFVGAAGLGFSRYLTNWRDMKVVRLIAGALVPLAILLAYLWAAGALESFYVWNIHFNVTVYAPHESRSIANFFSHLAKLVNGFYKNSSVYFYLALGGLAIAISQEVKRARKTSGTRARTLRSSASSAVKFSRILTAEDAEERRGGRGGGYLMESAPVHAVIMSPLVYFVFCMIDIQSGPDLIPLVPFVAIFAAVALGFVVEQTGNLFNRMRPATSRAAIEACASIVIVTFILVRNVSGEFFFERGFPTLKDQEPAVQEMVSHLEPGDKIFVYGRSEVLVLSGLTNVSKYFVLDRGKARYLDLVELGGFDGWVEGLKAERPRIVVLDRLGTDGALKPLEDWVAAEYEMRNNRVFSYYIRK